MIAELALFIFTTLAGIAAGAYIAKSIFPLKADREKPWMFGLVMLVLLGISGIALLMHLGHPERVMLAFTNLGAGIAQEGVATILFGLAVVADTVLGFMGKPTPRVVDGLAAIFGLLLTIAMGLTYYNFLGTAAWATPATVAFFVLGSLAMGAGAYLLFNREALTEGAFGAYNVAVQVCAAIAICAVVAAFMAAEQSIVLLVAGLVIGPVAAAIAGYMAKSKPNANMATVVCAAAIVGIAIARYGFYTASIL